MAIPNIPSQTRNINALEIIERIRGTRGSLSQSIERLSTGLRINSAKDDAGGFVLSRKLETQFRGLDYAAANTQNSYSLINVGLNAIDKITELLQDIRTSALAASNTGASDLSSRLTYQTEIQEKLDEINRIATQTTFNDKYLLNGTYTSSIDFRKGSRDFGGNISFSSDPTLLNGNAFLSLSQIQEGSEVINSGGDGTIHTNMLLSTDIAVTSAQFYTGAAVAGADTVSLASLDFNRVTLNNGGTVTFSGVLADGSTAFNGIFTITDTNTIADLITTLQTQVDNAETALGINSVGGTNPYETNIQYNASTGRLEFYGGATGTPSQFDIDMSVKDAASNEQTKIAITRDETVSHEVVATTDSGARIGNSLTAITGSTFMSGEFSIEVSNIQAAQERTIETSTGFFDEVSLVNPVTNVNNNIIGKFVQGFEIENNDIFYIEGTDPDGTTFSTQYQVQVAADGTAGNGVIKDFQDLIDELNYRDRTGTSFGFNNAVATFSNGTIQIIDDIAGSSSTNFTISIEDATTSTIAASIDADIVEAGNKESATISVDGGTAQTVEAGDIVTFQGGYSPLPDQPTPEVTLRISSGLAEGTDTMVIQEQIYTGSLNGGPTVTFQNGEQGVRFTTGKASVYPIAQFQEVKLDFDKIVDITSESSEIFVLSSTSRDLNFHIGMNEDEISRFLMTDLRPSSLGTSASQSLDSINVTTLSGADEALTIVDNAIDQVTQVAGRFGAFASRLEDTTDQLDFTSFTVEAAYDQIVSADLAEETTNLTLQTILMETQTALLVQANTTPVKLLEILYGLE